MAIVVEYPTMSVKYMAINDVYLSADDDSVDQHCDGMGWNLVSYEPEIQRFSNDGALMYQYWDVAGSKWVLESGFRRVVSRLTYTE